MSHLYFQSVPGVFQGTINLPSSKSISNRVLIIRNLGGWNGNIKNLSDADDTKLLETILCSDLRLINTENAGTVMRFLTAFLSLKNGEHFLDGSVRMRERPIGPLVKALRSIGADITYNGTEGYPPLKIIGKDLEGGEINIKPEISSQFISALLLIAPMMENGLKIFLTDVPVSAAYISMTIELMKYFEVNVDVENNTYSVRRQNYVPKEITIEPDWSSAPYIYALATLNPGSKIRINGLNRYSTQADQIIVEIMENFGVRTVFDHEGAVIESTQLKPDRFEFDFSSCPDLVPVMTVVCAVHNIPFYFKGTEHLRYKETDRSAVLQHELKKIGKIISVTEDGIFSEEYRAPFNSEVILDANNDHRLSMSFALFLCIDHKIGLKGADAVTKSYPGFWKDIEMLGIKI